MKQKNQIVVIIFFMLALPVLLLRAAPAEASAPLNSEQLEAFSDRFFNRAYAEELFPGAALVIVKDGEVVFSGGYGYANLEESIPVKADQTVFFTESVSKSFTATALMQLAEKDLLDLHADLNLYLEDMQLESSFAKPVTTADLLLHTAGFDDTDIGAYARSENEVIPLRDYVINNLPALVMPPGEAVSYSNHGYALAGLLAETISGINFTKYMDEEILKPLGMNNSSFVLNEEMEKSLALPYLRQNDSYLPGIFLYHNYSPAGGLKATAFDMASFIIANLEDGRFEGNQLLQKQTVETMHRRQFGHHDKLPGWAYGFYEQYINGYRCLAHGGSNRLGHSSMLFLLPEENFGYFLALNTFNLELHDAFLAELMDRFYPGPDEASLLQPAPGQNEQFDRYAGYYYSTRQSKNSIEKIMMLLGQLRITAEPGYLEISNYHGIEEPNRWSKAGPMIFQNRDNGSLIAFRENEAGEITHLFIENHAFERLPWHSAAPFQAAALLFILFAFISAVAAWPFTCLRKSCRGTLLRPEKTGLFSAFTLCLFNLLFLISLAVIFINYQVELAFGMPGVLTFLFMIPYAIIIVTGFVLYSSVKLWAGKRLNLFCRVHITIIALSAAGFSYFLYFWNLMGFHR